eukprot:gene32190-42977_t
MPLLSCARPAAADMVARFVAEDGPRRTMTLVLPFAAGSGTDTTTRIISQHLGQALGVGIVIDNKPGANGSIAATYVARAAPDGYTLFVTTNTSHSANPFLLKTMTYDPHAADRTGGLVAGLGALLHALHQSLRLNGCRAREQQHSDAQRGTHPCVHLHNADRDNHRASPRRRTNKHVPRRYRFRRTQVHSTGAATIGSPVDPARGVLLNRDARRSGAGNDHQQEETADHRIDVVALLKSQAPVHGVALGATLFGQAELEASRDMKVVARIGVGYDAVDVPALSRHKVPLMVAGTANSPSVAEQAMFMMLTLAKRAVELHALVKDGKWSTRLGLLPFDLFGKTVLIVGFGRIGTRMAKRCLAMEMTVLVYDPYKPADEIRAAGCEAVTDLDAALPRADFLTLHCPKTAETTALIDAARLTKMKPTAYRSKRWSPQSSGCEAVADLDAA